MTIVQTVVCLLLAALAAAIGSFWAYVHPYSDALFSALMACVAVSGILAFVGIGGVISLTHIAFARWSAGRRYGFGAPLTGYVPLEKPQPTL